MSTRSVSPWQGRTRRQKRADVDSRSEVKHQKAVSQLETGGSSLGIQSNTVVAAQHVSAQAKPKVKWVEPEEVPEPYLDGANLLHNLAQVDAWFKAQKTKLICPCGTAQ
ncbi:hypothetical protein COCOBI_10-3700 [Coccomyxa sp. Obi]|nr:hypothetical protein COCOBI_10-3700 [Coccomyxa sp. Obi]